MQRVIAQLNKQTLPDCIWLLLPVNSTEGKGWGPQI